MIAGRFFVTPHAVRQFRSRYRWRGDVSFEQAQGELIRLIESARYIKPTHNGAELWKTGRPERLRLIVDPTTKPLPAVVTVLPVRRKSDNVGG